VAGLVSKIKVRTSEKGRFAFVTMSDEAGVFEVSIFKEEILNRYRAQLDGGAMIVAQVDGKREENGTRLILQSMQLLEDAVASVQSSAMPRRLNIIIDSPLAVGRLRNILGEPNGSGTHITLWVVIDEKQKVEITLPGQYALNPNILMQIPSLEGVIETAEAA
jgi:DNA polymerase-3 subunit alpha